LFQRGKYNIVVTVKNEDVQTLREFLKVPGNKRGDIIKTITKGE
jgi:hypothetical protein